MDEPMEDDLFCEYSYAELRAIVRENLTSFPEAGALSPSEMEAAVGRIMSQSDPSTSVGSPRAGMVRLSDEDIAVFMYHRETEAPSVDDLPCGVFPPGWIEERRRQLEEQCRLPAGKMKANGEDNLRVLLAKIRVDLLARGYVDVPVEFLKAQMEQGTAGDNAGAACIDEDPWSMKKMMKVLQKIMHSPTQTYCL